VRSVISGKNQVGISPFRLSVHPPLLIINKSQRWECLKLAWVTSPLRNSDMTWHLRRVGLVMSENLQKHLSKEGYPPLIMWNRTTSRADSVKKLGAIVGDRVEDARILDYRISNQ